MKPRKQQGSRVNWLLAAAGVKRVQHILGLHRRFALRRGRASKGTTRNDTLGVDAATSR
jgi:hypothetical protein